MWSSCGARLVLVVALGGLVLLGCGPGYEGPPLAEEVDPVVARWEAAYDSADLDQVRGVFAEDGVFFTLGDFHDLVERAYVVGRLGPDGPEFERRFWIHEGDDLSVSDVVQVGDGAIAFRWAWQEFAAGTGTMAVRDGRLAVVTLTTAPALEGFVPDEVDPIVEEFRRAATSGDVDGVRALCNEGFVFTTVAAAHAIYRDDAEGAEALADGSQLETWLADHDGEELAIVDPIQVGEGIAFVWGWSGGDAGTGVMDVEDGRISTVALTDGNAPPP